MGLVSNFITRIGGEIPLLGHSWILRVLACPKMSKGKKDDISCLCWSLTRAALSGSVHCFSQDRSFFVSIMSLFWLRQSVLCLFRCAIRRSVNPNKGMYDISTFNNVPSAITECKNYHRNLQKHDNTLSNLEILTPQQHHLRHQQHQQHHPRP